MLKIFLRSPLPNTLAVAVLVSLLVVWITSLVLSLRDAPVNTERGWYPVLLPAFSLLGIPAVIDLLQAEASARVYAVLVCLVFLANIFVPILRARGRVTSPLTNDWYRWSILFSALAGLAVAAYLTLVDQAGGNVSCGPSGGCVTVQHSKYAVLFGVLPVATLGLLGYLGILAGWIAWQFGSGELKRLAPLAIWGMCIFGTLFSVYLTFLEPFVIGATCMWCISSAVLMITLLLLCTPAAREVLAVPEDE